MVHKTITDALTVALDTLRDLLLSGEPGMAKLLADPEKVDRLQNMMALANAWLEVQDVPSSGMVQTPVYKTATGMRVAIQAWILAVSNESGEFEVAAATGSDAMAEAFCEGNDTEYNNSPVTVIRVLTPKKQMPARPVRYFSTKDKDKA